MCYTVIWIDEGTYEPYCTQEIASASREEAWTEIQKKSPTCKILALVLGHHGVIFDKHGLTKPL